MKPFAESSEQNKKPILSVLRHELANNRRVLEVGSGTGQHAVYFAEQMPHLTWVCSDLQENHAGIRLWLSEAGLTNIEGPLVLDARDEWTDIDADVIFSANAVHIMSWDAVVSLMDNVGRTLGSGGKLCLYGPFMYDGQHTAESNASFDIWLKQRDPLSGVRDVSKINALLEVHGMFMTNDYEMPVNNRILVWQKR